MCLIFLLSVVYKCVGVCVYYTKFFFCNIIILLIKNSVSDEEEGGMYRFEGMRTVGGSFGGNNRKSPFDCTDRVLNRRLNR